MYSTCTSFYAVNNVGYLCDNIGLILACLPSGSTDVTASDSRYITKPSGIPILSPVLFIRVGDPYILRFDLLVIIEGILKVPIVFLLSSSHSSEVSVLVPGAGLGRLAYEIASRGFTCQGNEFSMHMLFGSNFILNRYVHVMPMTLPLHTYMYLYTGTHMWLICTLEYTHIVYMCMYVHPRNIYTCA